MQRRQVWHARYRVTARSGLGPTRNLRVVTWLGPEKAIAMAVRAGGRGYGTGDGIDDVAVWMAWARPKVIGAVLGSSELTCMTRLKF